jgi:hypothetical protein
MDELNAAGLVPLLLGGWAEELHGMAPPRGHRDVDVVLLDPAPQALEAFLSDRPQINEKRLSHKRAYVRNDVLVELFLALQHGERYQTLFWGQLAWLWPHDMVPVTIAGVSVAPRSALEAFRASYPAFMDARDAAIRLGRQQSG